MKLSLNNGLMLKKLSNGPKTLIELTTGYEVSQNAKHFERYLADCQELGYAIQIGEHWHISQHGIDKLNNKPKAVSKGLLPSWKDRSVYEGLELKNNSVRPGAYTFLSWPSLINGARVYRKDAV